MTVFGTGVELESDFDLLVSDITGSLSITSGTDIIERDTAFTLARQGARFRGQPSTAGGAADIEATVRRLLNRDPRIISVQNVTVRSQNAPKTIVVEATITTATEETEALLIEISQ
jgi:hypothetical protein